MIILGITRLLVIPSPGVMMRRKWDFTTCYRKLQGNGMWDVSSQSTLMLGRIWRQPSWNIFVHHHTRENGAGNANDAFKDLVHEYITDKLWLMERVNAGMTEFEKVEDLFRRTMTRNPKLFKRHSCKTITRPMKKAISIEVANAREHAAMELETKTHQENGGWNEKGERNA